MTEAKSIDRCRIVLIAPEGADPEQFAATLREAIAGGDIASLILPQYGSDEVSFQQFAETIAPIAQEAGIAVVVAGDSRVVGRVKADGVHVDGLAQLSEAIERFQSKISVGAGGIKTRDEALDIGEFRPDYVFFGRFGYDNKPEAHHRNLGLGAWWAEMIQIPCIVMGGSDIESVRQVAETGAEFVALSSAIFGDGVDPREAVARANALLDAFAPVLADAE